MPRQRIRGPESVHPSISNAHDRALDAIRRLMRRPELHWCHGCGDRVVQLGFDDLCPLCVEIDARLDAHLGSAARDLAERLIELSLDYLNPEDVQAVLDECVAERTGSPAPLDELFERSFHFVDARARRADTRGRFKPPVGSVTGERSIRGAIRRRLRRR